MNNKFVWLVVIACMIALIASLIKLSREVAFHRLQEQELDTYATEVETVYQQMQGIRHDYRNHLQVMSAYLTKQDYSALDDYLLALTNELNQVDTIIRTGNTLIDAIVNTKLTRAKQQGVTLYANALAPAQLDLETIDLAILLGNLMNNALEATTRPSKQTPSDADEQFIRLYIAPMKDNLYISVTNTMAENPGTNFLSWKAPNRQGYGLKRIGQVVDKYDGIMKQSWEEGIFATEITLPLNSDHTDKIPQQ